MRARTALLNKTGRPFPETDSAEGDESNDRVTHGIRRAAKGGKVRRRGGRSAAEASLGLGRGLAEASAAESGADPGRGDGATPGRPRRLCVRTDNAARTRELVPPTGNGRSVKGRCEDVTLSRVAST